MGIFFIAIDVWKLIKITRQSNKSPCFKKKFIDI